MLYWPRRVVLGMLLMAPWGCGSDEGSLACGPGTHEEESACVPDVTCGEGTHPEGSSCVRDTELPPPDTWTENVRVSVAGQWTAEPSVAADTDGHVFVAFMEGPTPYSYVITAVLYGSEDGGGSFQRIADYPSPDGFSGDVTLAASPEGDFYFGWIDYTTNAGNEYFGDVLVVSSHDHGKVWSSPTQINVDAGDILNDRPWLAVAEDGSVHASWISLDRDYDSWTSYARSEDGDAWARPVAIPQPPNLFAWNTTALTVTVEGEVLIPMEFQDYFADEASVGFMYSDNGQFFSMHDLTRTAQSTRDLTLLPRPLVSATPTGRVCFAFEDAPERNFGVYATIAEDGWNFDLPAEPLDGALASTATMPWMTADPEGRCHAIWLDNRSGDWEVWAATIRTDGDRSPPERVSDATFTEDGSRAQWLGDFNAITVGGDTRFAVWTDTRGGESAIYFSTSPLEGP